MYNLEIHTLSQLSQVYLIQVLHVWCVVRHVQCVVRHVWCVVRHVWCVVRHVWCVVRHVARPVSHHNTLHITTHSQDTITTDYVARPLPICDKTCVTSQHTHKTLSQSVLRHRGHRLCHIEVLPCLRRPMSQDLFFTTHAPPHTIHYTSQHTHKTLSQQTMLQDLCRHTCNTTHNTLHITTHCTPQPI